MTLTVFENLNAKVLGHFGQVGQVFVFAEPLSKFFILTLNILQRFPEKFKP